MKAKNQESEKLNAPITSPAKIPSSEMPEADIAARINTIETKTDEAKSGMEGRAAEADLTGRRFGALTVVKRAKAKSYECLCDCGERITVFAADLLRGHNTSCGCMKGKSRRKDLTGLRSGSVVALELTDKKRGGAYLWRCRCDCGKELLVEAYRLSGGIIKSCGCRRSAAKVKDLTGQRFGRLVAEKRLEEDRGSGRLWLCRCDCGNYTKVSPKALISGNTKSCGCAKRKAAKETLARHGTVADHNHFVDGTCVELLKRKKLNSNNTSGYTGVQKRPNGRWAAIITFKGKVHYLGIYDRIEDAVAARKRGEEEYFEPFLERYRQDDT